MSEAALLSYVNFFHKLDKGNLENLETVMTEDIHFIDPFNDVVGLDKVKTIFHHMFLNMPDSKFVITQYALAHKEQATGLLHWNFIGTAPGAKRPIKITGMSILRFGKDGRVSEHIDHWDAAQQFYERIPVLNLILRRIRKRIEV